MPNAHDYTVRCYTCGERLVVIDRWTPTVTGRDGNPVADQPRPWDPDWVLERHHQRAH
jgi:hypothetical protein